MLLRAEGFTLLKTRGFASDGWTNYECSTFQEMGKGGEPAVIPSYVQADAGRRNQLSQQGRQSLIRENLRHRVRFRTERREGASVQPSVHKRLAVTGPREK